MLGFCNKDVILHLVHYDNYVVHYPNFYNINIKCLLFVLYTQYDTTGKALYVSILPCTYTINNIAFWQLLDFITDGLQIFLKKFLHTVSSILSGRKSIPWFFQGT